MAKAIKHITAGLLQIEVIGTAGTAGAGGPELRHLAGPTVLQ